MPFPTGAEMAQEMFGYDTPEKLSEWQEQYDASMKQSVEPLHVPDPSAGLKLAATGANAPMHRSTAPRQAEPEHDSPNPDDGMSLDF